MKLVHCLSAPGWLAWLMETVHAVAGACHTTGTTQSEVFWPKNTYCISSSTCGVLSVSLPYIVNQQEMHIIPADRLLAAMPG